MRFLKPRRRFGNRFEFLLSLAARQLSQQSEAELRKPLRASLTHLALAGLPRSEILAIVNEELQQFFGRRG